MNAMDFMNRANRLEDRINASIAELEKLKQTTAAVSSPNLKEQVMTSRNTDAPFERKYIRLVEMQEKINANIERFIELKEEIRDVIDQVDDPDEQVVLQYRYLLNMPMREIAKTLFISEATVYRWHASALQHIVLPEKYR